MLTYIRSHAYILTCLHYAVMLCSLCAMYTNVLYAMHTNVTNVTSYLYCIRHILFNYVLYCIVLYLLPVLNPMSYDGARVLEASSRPMLVIGRSYWVLTT